MSDFEVSSEPSSPIRAPTPAARKSTRKATVKKLPKVESVVIKFDCDKYNEDDVTLCMEKHTPFSISTKSAKKGENQFTMKVNRSENEGDNVHYTKEFVLSMVNEHIEKYKEMRLRKERIRKCDIKEIDGKFYMHVGKKGSYWGYDSDDTDGEEFEIFL